MRSKDIHLRISEKEHKELKKIAEKTERNISQIVRMAIKGFLSLHFTRKKLDKR